MGLRDENSSTRLKRANYLKLATSFSEIGANDVARISNREGCFYRKSAGLVPLLQHQVIAARLAELLL